MTLIWPDYNPADPNNAANAVANKWLRVTVKANANTGLTSPDVFYFGNLIGESYYDATQGYINALDQSNTRQNFASSDLVTVENLWDHNRDDVVNGTDVDIVTSNLYKQLILLAAPA